MEVTLKYCPNEIWPDTSVLCMTNISNMFLAQCLLENSSSPFYNFIKMTIARSGHF